MGNIPSQTQPTKQRTLFISQYFLFPWKPWVLQGIEGFSLIVTNLFRSEHLRQIASNETGHGKRRVERFPVFPFAGSSVGEVSSRRKVRGTTRELGEESSVFHLVPVASSNSRIEEEQSSGVINIYRLNRVFFLEQVNGDANDERSSVTRECLSPRILKFR